MYSWIRKCGEQARGIVRTSTKEDWAVATFGTSFLVGVWYAFPMVNTITDVWAFGGGVLRALEAHTLLPGNDVAYGILSFYQNYIAMVFALTLALPFFSFDIDALQTALVLNPAYSLAVSRIVSALTAMVLLGFVYHFLKREVTSLWWRLALLILTFGNVLAVLLIRSGKMWILSTTLGIISFIYLYHALTVERERGQFGKYTVISIVSAFLATANFTFAGLFLVTIPILWYLFPKTRHTFLRLTLITLAGFSLFALFFLLNAENTLKQLSGFISPFVDSTNPSIGGDTNRLTFLEAFTVNVRHVIEAFPLLLIALGVVAFTRMQNRLLGVLALVYSALYLTAVAVVFRSDDGLALNVRHIFPLCFFLLFLLTAYRPPSRTIAQVFLAVGVATYLYALFLLSVPTTYNLARDYIVTEYKTASIRIHEDIFEFTLPMNVASYELFGDQWCGSTCRYIRNSKIDNGFTPIVTTGETDQAHVIGATWPDIIITDTALPMCTPLRTFVHDVPDHTIFDIDINLGRMLMPEFYRLKRLGKNIYLYEGATCHAPLTMRTGGAP